MDGRYRILLDKKIRMISGFKRGDRILVIPFKGGVILLSPSRQRFEGSPTRVGDQEELHEASRFIFRRRN